MALGIYEETSPGVYSAFSTDGEFSNPITTVHNGQTGDTIEQELFVHANDAGTYTNIQVKPASLTAEDDIGDGDDPGDTGWGVKLMVDPGHTPTEEEWDAVDYGAAIDITGNPVAEYLSFWMRIESPRSIRIKNKQNITLYILSTES